MYLSNEEQLDALKKAMQGEKLAYPAHLFNGGALKVATIIAYCEQNGLDKQTQLEEYVDAPEVADVIVKITSPRQPGKQLGWYHPTAAEPDFSPLPDDILQRIRPSLEHVCPLYNDLLRYTREYSPRSLDLFRIGAVLHTLSTISAGRIKIELSAKGTLTDLYLLNCAYSSVYSKSEPNLINQMVMKQCGLDFLQLPSHMSPSRMFTKMIPNQPTGMETSTELEYLEMSNRHAGQRGMYFDEMGNYIESLLDGGYNADWSRILREIKTYPDKLEHSTNIHGDRIIRYPFLTLLGNATPDDFWAMDRNKLNRLKGDGFWARFWVATPSEKDFPRYAITYKLAKPSQSLITGLRRWHNSLPQQPENHDAQFERVILPMSIEVKQLHSQFDRWLFEIDVDKHPEWKPNYIRHSQNVVALAGLFSSVNGKDVVGLDEYLLAIQIGEQYRMSLHRFFSLISNPKTQNLRKKQEDEIIARMHRYAENGSLPIYKSQLWQRLEKNPLFANTTGTYLHTMLIDMAEAELLVIDGKKIHLPDFYPE